MKFGIVAAKEIEKAHELAREIRQYLESKDHQVLDERQLKGAEVVVILGGDGTLIHTACEHVELNVPFVGINVGTLGFLTAAEADSWQEAVEKLIKGEYVVSERMTLDASLEANSKSPTLPRSSTLRSSTLRLGLEELRPEGLRRASEIQNPKFRALNEVVIKGLYRVISLAIIVDGQKFLSIVGDGVLISTQTGSTAYSLSAGGPIVDPAVDCFLITPINAVGLPIPSVALSPKNTVEIKVKRGDAVSLIIDGQEHTKIAEGQTIKVWQGKYRVKFGYFDKHYFLKALNAKFGLASRLVG